MKGIVLAGGTGSRLLPLTKVTNKHLLPVGDKPMIFHPIERLVEAGVENIMLVTGTEHMGDMISLLGSGSSLNCKLTYRVQDKPDGIAGALLLCEDFVGEDDCIVILGDNIFFYNLKNDILSFSNRDNKGITPECKLLLKSVTKPERFGIAEINNSGNIIRIIEKPKKPKSNMCVTGIYMYDKNVFNFIKSLSPSNRGELEITDINNRYLREGLLYYGIIDTWWSDAGTFQSLNLSNTKYWKNKNDEY
jgi:glucose-1-phosphate thymidylyltransferase